MKRLLARLVPVIAVAVSLGCLCGVPRAALAATVTATFTDAGLYSGVKAALAAQSVACTPNDANKTITLEDAARDGVTELTLSNVEAKNTAGLGTFTELTKLDLSHNGITDISGLAGLSKLTELDLYDNYVHDFSALSGKTTLTKLNLGDNNEKAQGALQGLAALNTLSGLTWLDFSRNYAPGITANVSNLTQLRHLHLQQNGITDLSGLKDLTQLKTLILAHNKVAGISALLGLAQLEELDLQSNALYKTDVGASDTSGINGLVKADGTLALPKLKKLDVYNNSDWNGFVGAGSQACTEALLKLFLGGQLELGFSYGRIKDYDAAIAAVGSQPTGAPRLTKLASLPHTDGGVSYVTYDDFGAYADGVHDDWNAIRNAHTFANACGCEVRGTAGKTYHIFRKYDLAYQSVYTNVDWKGATFVLHDEKIDELGVRYTPLLCLRPSPARTEVVDGKNVTKYAYDAIVTLGTGSAYTTPISGWNNVLGKSTTSVATQLGSTLMALNAKGYNRYYVQVFNAGKKQYRRFGSNENGGSAQEDSFIVDGAGKLEDGQKLQWDFEQVTKVIVTPIPAERSYVKNGTFQHVRPSREHEVPRAVGKTEYYLRNLQLRDCANVELANIRHTVGSYAGATFTPGDVERLTGSYYGFFSVMNCADVNMHDCTAWARKYAAEGRSTYGITINHTNLITLTQVNNANSWEQQMDPQRWGLTGNNHCKHITYDHCTLSRIDAHEGYYDLTARDCKLGSWGFRLIGQGPMLIERCEVHSNSFIMLRYDYGSTWDGEATIKDCRHYIPGAYSQGLFQVSVNVDAGGALHDFGYELHMPELYVENLTVDLSEYQEGSDYYSYYIIPNYTYSNISEKLPVSYWPSKVHVNGVNFVNYGTKPGFQPHFRMAFTETGTVMGKYPSYEAQDVSYGGDVGHLDLATASAFALQHKEDGQLVSTLPFEITGTNNAGMKDNRADVAPADFANQEVAIEFTGDIPRIALMDAAWKGWVGIDPYYVSGTSGTRVAYFSAAEIAQKWAAKKGTAWTTESGSGVVGDVGKLQVQSTGTTTINRIVHGAEVAHTHSWGAWTVVEAATCTEPAVERRVCAGDSSHVETRAAGEPLGHSWGVWQVVKAATATEDGEERRVCTRDASHVETRAIPKTGGGSGGGTDGGSGSDASGSGTGGGSGSGASSGEGSGSSGGSGSGDGSGSGSGDGSGSGSSGGSGAGGGSGSDSTSGGGSGNSGDVSAKGWSWNATNGTWVYSDGGNRPFTGWVKDQNAWYFVSINVMCTGWLHDTDGSWYYLNEAHDGTFGAMLCSRWQWYANAWYYLRGNGTMAHDAWLQDNGQWYYLAADGAMAREAWLLHAGAWYYLGWDGAMLHDARAPDGSWLAGDGRWLG